MKQFSVCHRASFFFFPEARRAVLKGRYWEKKDFLSTAHSLLLFRSYPKAKPLPPNGCGGDLSRPAETSHGIRAALGSCSSDAPLTEVRLRHFHTHARSGPDRQRSSGPGAPETIPRPEMVDLRSLGKTWNLCRKGHICSVQLDTVESEEEKKKVLLSAVSFLAIILVFVATLNATNRLS